MKWYLLRNVIAVAGMMLVVYIGVYCFVCWVLKRDYN